MAGYRQSGYDPRDYPRYGRPLRPYNWAQWAGVGLMLVGLAIYLLYFAGRFGWIRQVMDSPIIGIAPFMFGSILINSRREDLPDSAPELAADRRKWMAIIVAICAVVLGIATIFALKGY